jgi:hypothetical protein
MPVVEVKPGDLITADYINKLVQLLNALEVKVNSMGGSVPNVLIIERLVPPAPGPYKVGQRVEIIGQNLGFLTSFMQIFIDNKQIFEEQGSNDKKAFITIEDLPNLPREGRRVKLRVVNRISEEEIDIDVLPADIPLNGNVTTTWKSTSPATIEAGDEIDFEFDSVSTASRLATYTIEPVVTLTGPGIAPTAGNVIRDAMLVLNAQKQVIPNKQIELDIASVRDPAPVKKFYLRALQFPAVPNGTKMTLVVVLKAEGKSWSSTAKEFTVGEAVEDADHSITLSFQEADPPAAFIQEGTNRILQLQPNTDGALLFKVTFTVAGTYNLIVPADPVSGWIVRRSPGTDPSYVVTLAQLGRGGRVDEDVTFLIEAPAARSAEQPVIELGLQRQGNPLKQTAKFTLRMPPNP